MVYLNSFFIGDRIYCELKNCIRELDIFQGDVYYVIINGNNLIGFYFSIEEYVKLYFGECQINYVIVCLLMFIYVIIFLSGLVGNIFMVFVILKNVYMCFVMNYYLLSFFMVDFFIIVFGKLLLLIKNFVKCFEIVCLKFFVVFVFSCFLCFVFECC